MVYFIKYFCNPTQTEINIYNKDKYAKVTKKVNRLNEKKPFCYLLSNMKEHELASCSAGSNLFRRFYLSLTKDLQGCFRRYSYYDL